MANSSVGGASKELSCQCRRHKRRRFSPWVGKIPWRRARQPTPVFLPGESHGQRILVGYCPRGHKELDMTERLHFDSFSSKDDFFYDDFPSGSAGKASVYNVGDPGPSPGLR